MGQNELPRNREAQAIAARASRSRSITPVKALEYMGQVVSWDARPGVLHMDGDVIPFALGRDRHVAAWRCMGHGIVEQIAQRLAEPPSVNPDIRYVVGDFGADSESLLRRGNRDRASIVRDER